MLQLRRNDSSDPDHLHFPFMNIAMKTLRAYPSLQFKMTAKSAENTPKSSKKRRHDDDMEPSKEIKPAKKEKKHKDKSKDKKTKSKEKLSKEDKKAAKKAAEDALLAMIPKVDEDGIPYNKIQIRRMKRRVKHGLDPIPTEEEEKEINKRKEEEKREVEELFADRDKEEEEGEEEEEEEEENAGTADEGSDDQPIDEADDDEQEEPQHQPIYKKPRSKPVPPDYICSACKNQPPSSDQPFTPHWIYDCPSKITKRGCNTKSKRTRGLTDPPSRKVFVSGLPFDVTERGVKSYFDKAGEVVHVKLLKFEDSQRCKGQGILTFDTDGGAKAALKFNGEVWVEDENGKKKKSKEKEGKELRLKVSKVLNRFLTKKQKRA